MPAIFQFQTNELKTPAAFLQCVSRAVEEYQAQNQKSKHDPLSTTKLYQTVTNGFDFEYDQWFDLVFDVGQQAQLDNVIQKVVEASHVLQPGRPPMLPGIIEMATNSTPHVQALVSKHVEMAASNEKINWGHTVETGFLAP